MATFYVLPPRSCLDDALGSVLGRLLPGLPIPADTWDVIAAQLAGTAGWPDDVYVIPRDDLLDGEPIAESLAAAFGAEPGDRVVEVGLAAAPRTWVLTAVPGSVAAR